MPIVVRRFAPTDRGGTGSGVDSGRILRFSFGPGSGVKKFGKNLTWIQGHFSILLVADVCVVIS